MASKNYITFDDCNCAGCSIEYYESIRKKRENKCMIKNCENIKPKQLFFCLEHFNSDIRLCYRARICLYPNCHQYTGSYSNGYKFFCREHRCFEPCKKD